MLTCYDYTTATLLQQAGVDMLLVGDSASNVILGHDSTLPISLEFLIELTAAVRRGAPHCLIVGDMPFGSYHESTAQAVRNTVRMVKESGCGMVKLEVTRSADETIRRLADAGVATIAHLGLQPQAVGLLGGYRFRGRTADEASAIVRTAEILATAGAAAVLLEAVPPEVAAAVVDAIHVPVIGCGGGPVCHGHVVVLQDLLRQTPRQARFVPRYDVQRPAIEVARQYVNQVRERAYPVAEHCYEMPADEKAKFVGQDVVSTQQFSRS